jgi:hypothetical protein
MRTGMRTGRGMEMGMGRGRENGAVADEDDVLTNVDHGGESDQNSGEEDR